MLLGLISSCIPAPSRIREPIPIDVPAIVKLLQIGEQGPNDVESIVRSATLPNELDELDRFDFVAGRIQAYRITRSIGGISIHYPTGTDSITDYYEIYQIIAKFNAAETLVGFRASARTSLKDDWGGALARVWPALHARSSLGSRRA